MKEKPKLARLRKSIAEGVLPQKPFFSGKAQRRGRDGSKDVAGAVMAGAVISSGATMSSNADASMGECCIGCLSACAGAL